MRKSDFLFMGMVLFFILSSSANAGIRLYKDYSFGMTKTEIMKKSGVYDCSQEFESGSLCLDNQKFVGEPVELGFRFVNNQLVSVVLFTDFTQDNYLKFLGALGSKFEPITIESSNEKVDLLVLKKNHKEAELLKQISDFEQQAIASGYVNYTFIDKTSYQKYNSSSNTVEMILKADNSMRAVEYIISEDDEYNVFGVIIFSAPKKMVELIREKSKQKYEDF